MRKSNHKGEGTLKKRLTSSYCAVEEDIVFVIHSIVDFGVREICFFWSLQVRGDQCYLTLVKILHHDLGLVVCSLSALT